MATVGLDRKEGVLPSCGPSTYQAGAQIAYIDPLRRYVMTFVCIIQPCPSAKNCRPQSLSLFYSTATSLSAQDWTIPRPIQHSTYAYRTDPKGGWTQDGAYPSFVSPECKPGHLGNSGEVFLLKGNPTGPDREFVARTFEIRSTAGYGKSERTPTPVAERFWTRSAMSPWRRRVNLRVPATRTIGFSSPRSRHVHTITCDRRRHNGLRTRAQRHWRKTAVRRRVILL